MAFEWLGRLDVAGFEAVAGSRSRVLDWLLPRLSRSADHGMLWMAIAAALTAVGGRAGRTAASKGLGSTALTSLLVNQVIKRAVGRRRPARASVPGVRRVPVPATSSFPSGHAASAAAFATAATHEVRGLRLPLGGLAAAVAISRVYVGVHYPLDVLAGAAAGTAVGRVVSTSTRRVEFLSRAERGASASRLRARV